MDRERVRVLVVALASVGLLVATGFVLDWFTISVGGAGGLDGIAGATGVGITLRSVHGCAGDGCASTSLAQFGGLYPTLGLGTMIATGVLVALVALQAGARLVVGEARTMASRVGYWIAMANVMLILLAAYVFDPTLPTDARVEVFGVSIEVARSWAPALALVGTFAGVFALFYAVQTNADVTPPPLGVIVRKSTLVPPPPPAVVAPPVVAHPEVNYAVASADVSRAGIDARREDGSSRLVLWRDVVGIVVRRLPEAQGGSPFADVVSTADATLRVLPWSRLAGDPIASDDPDARLRALVAYVREHVPAIKLDPLTRAFVDGTEPPAQLPDAATLAEHDAHFA